RLAGVTDDQDARALGLERRRRGVTEQGRQLGREEGARLTADAIGPEQLPARVSHPESLLLRSPGRRDQRLLNCGFLRAFLKPALRRSLTRASRVRKPRRLRSPRSSASISVNALAMPWRTAPAWPETPPPWTRTRTSTLPS